MNPVKHLPTLALLVFVTVFSFTAQSDWINLTGAETSPNIAEIYVLDDHVKVKLEVYVGDLQTFEQLIPDDWIEDKDIEREPLAQRVKDFATKTLVFKDEDGNALPAELVLVEPRMRVDRRSPFAGMINPYTRQRVPEPPDDKRVLYAELIYPFDGKPRHVTMVPPQDEEGRAEVTLGFIAYHKAVPVIDFRYLGAPAKLNLDWGDPWYSKFDNPNLKRHHKSAMMSFLYIEPHEVRHEILIRVKDLEEWMDLGLRGDEYIEADELDVLKQRIGEFLLAKNPVVVDGKALKPILDRSNYVTVGIAGIQILEQPQRLEISTAIVGVILAYLTEGIPQQVTVDWELFTEQVQRVPATATDPAGPLPTYLTPDDNIHTWTNYLKTYTPPTVAQVSVKETVNHLPIPLLSVAGVLLTVMSLWWLWQRRRQQRSYRIPLFTAITGLAVAVIAFPYLNVKFNRPVALVSGLSPDESERVMHSLLKNVYRSFDFRSESDVYDKLALSVQGDLLEEIYLQNRKSFAVKKAGGAQARVQDIEIIQAQAEPTQSQNKGFELQAKWTAQGTVGHWGHIHTRKNYYDALVTVEVIDDHWKITGVELLEEKRLDPFSGAETKGNGPS
ncbi:MAG: hypothetical protein JSW45_05820 [Thiotrichales bacterium]|nr:MAG: hypothetical protein JSW45_05820 [Thiotrichales bacterium]